MDAIWMCHFQLPTCSPMLSTPSYPSQYCRPASTVIPLLHKVTFTPTIHPNLGLPHTLSKLTSAINMHPSIHMVLFQSLRVSKPSQAICAINNLAYNEHTNTYFKCYKILKLSDQYKLKVSNYIFQLLHFDFNEKIVSNLLDNNQIHSHNTSSNNQMSILQINRSQTKYCVLHNAIIT